MDMDAIFAQMVRDGFAEVRTVKGEKRYRLTEKGIEAAKHAMATKPEMADLYARLEADRVGATAVKEPKRRQ